MSNIPLKFLLGIPSITRLGSFLAWQWKNGEQKKFPYSDYAEVGSKQFL